MNPLLLNGLFFHLQLMQIELALHVHKCIGSHLDTSFVCSFPPLAYLAFVFSLFPCLC